MAMGAVETGTWGLPGMARARLLQQAAKKQEEKDAKPIDLPESEAQEQIGWQLSKATPAHRVVMKKEAGVPGTPGFRVMYFDLSGWQVSPWHSVALYSREGLLSFICTTPAGSWLRHDMSRSEPCNPLRIVPPSEGIGSAERSRFASNAPWNVGLLPQTLATEARTSPPLQIIDIGANTVRKVGQVYAVKPLAAFCTGEGQGTWQIVAIAADDPMAEVISDTEDLDAILPGTLEMVREWLRTCKCNSDGESLESIDYSLESMPTIEGPWMAINVEICAAPTASTKW